MPPPALGALHTVHYARLSNGGAVFSERYVWRLVVENNY